MAVQDPIRWFRRQAAPATTIICALIIIGFLVTWSAPGFVGENLIYPGLPFPKFWTLFTYPFMQFSSPIFLVFQLMWVYWVGSILERDHGSPKFAYLWLAICAIGVLPLSIFKFSVGGMYIPDAILIAIWGSRYPNMTVRIFMCIPVAAKWLAILVVAGIFFMYASGPDHIAIGLAAISGCILGFLYAKNLIPKVPYGLRHGSLYAKDKQTKIQKVREEKYYDDVYRREKEREERERLRKMFEDSLGEEK